MPGAALRAQRPHALLTHHDRPLKPDVADDGQEWLAALRAKEYSRLDAAGEAYLDFTGSALYSETQIAAHSERLRGGIFGNPHSENGPSRASTALIDEAKSRVLEFLGAPDSEYVVCFTANTSAAIKLVAESYPFSRTAPLVLAADNHNSMNGMREYARRKRAPVHYLPLDAGLELNDPARALRTWRNSGGLFGFPAQSNFSGVKHPLSLAADARDNGFAVLLDAAAFLPTSDLDLAVTRADFVVFSAYKIMGFPTGVGALVARKDALDGLRRPWFAGGTVEYASVQHRSRLMRDGIEAFEDGTPAFLSIAALIDGLDFIKSAGRERVAAHVASLTGYMIRSLGDVTHPDGSPAVRIYGPRATSSRGGTVAFNILRPDGTSIPFGKVVERARSRRVALRGGCFCNPGAAEAAFGFASRSTARCLRTASAHGFTIDKLSECLGPEISVGAVRASVGMCSSWRDVDRMVEVVGSFL